MFAYSDDSSISTYKLNELDQLAKEKQNQYNNLVKKYNDFSNKVNELDKKVKEKQNQNNQLIQNIKNVHNKNDIITKKGHSC